jgi:hypothetical protein
MNEHKTFQQEVRDWVVHCFGETVADDIATRCFRFFEEAGELCQSLGMRKEDANKLVDYVWSRPVGEPRQEIGGVMVTLAALATPAKLNMFLDGWAELARVNQPEITEKIRAKQKSKAAIGLGADPIPGHSDLGKIVTLQTALTAAPGFYLPQRSFWRIVGTRSDEYGRHWLVEHQTNELAPERIVGIYALPCSLCTEPRDEA